MTKTARRLASAAMGAVITSAMGSTALAAVDTSQTPPANGGGPAAAASPSASAASDYDVSQIATGGGVFSRMANYYGLEWGRPGPPTDPKTPAGRRQDFPPQPVTSPPYPFTEWPYGGATLLGANRPDSVDSPLMVGLAPTKVGQWMSDAHVQAYGWLDVGANLSTSHVEGGNAPAGYDYNPNRIQMDQAVLYIERTPDTVQRDHVDWGFRVSGIYGVDYRYTISDGLASNQLTKANKNYGWDLPMEYVEVFIPQVAQGLLLRAGRFIAIPDVEAQLAPNNYMYSHSLGYTYDNFTNTGVIATLGLTKNLFVQGALTDGTETFIGNIGEHKANPYPNPLYPGTSFPKDPGARLSYSGCIRYETDTARDDIYVCANGINSGQWGYNNLQWTGFTYYHQFTDRFHVAVEVYNLRQKDVPNVLNPQVQTIFANGGTPFSTADFRFNAPSGAQCRDPNSLKCTATAQAELAYWNYRFGPLDNLSLRTEYYDDQNGQRTGVATSYEDLAIGEQHWLSPQIELRPEIAWYYANDAKAFDGNGDHGIAPNRRQEVVLSGDAIFHF